MRSFRKKWFTLVLTAALCLGCMTVANQPCATALGLKAKAAAATIAPRAPIIGWRYQTIDGVLYRRLFNYTTQEWIGEWEPA